MHINKGVGLQKSLEAKITYIIDPAKTASKKFVSTYCCASETADVEWALAHRQYRDRTHRNLDCGVIAYQVRQSFAPGEVTPEEANRIGNEFAHRFLKDKYSFIVATHVDRDHIHNHIMWNAVSLEGNRKFRDFFLSAQAVRDLSDQICVEHLLSTITSPTRKGRDYKTWLGVLRKIPQRDMLRSSIDSALAQKPVDFDALLLLLENDGWEIKRGKVLSFRRGGFTRFARLDSLGDAYDEEALRAVISGSRQKQKQREQPWLRADRKIGLLIDIEAALQAGKGPGFEFWAKRENLKRAAKAVRMLEARGALDQHDLDPIVTKAIQEEKAILDQCQALDDKIAKIRILRQHIFNYSRTRKIAEEYRASGYSKKYAAEHKDELRQYREAKKAFDQLGQEALPKISELQREEHELIVEKQSKYSEYRRAKAISKELQEAKANVEGLLAHQAITADRLVRMERVEKTKY